MTLIYQFLKVVDLLTDEAPLKMLCLTSTHVWRARNATALEKGQKRYIKAQKETCQKIKPLMNEPHELINGP